MELNLKKVQKIAEKTLEKKFGKNFEYKMENGYLSIDTTYDITDDYTAYVSFTVFESGAVSFTMYGDLIDSTPENLELINKFNKNELYFKAYIDDDDALMFSHCALCLDESMLDWYLNEIYLAFMILDEDDDFIELIDKTYVEEDEED